MLRVFVWKKTSSHMDKMEKRFGGHLFFLVLPNRDFLLFENEDIKESV